MKRVIKAVVCLSLVVGLSTNVLAKEVKYTCGTSETISTISDDKSMYISGDGTIYFRQGYSNMYSHVDGAFEINVIFSSLKADIMQQKVYLDGGFMGADVCRRVYK